MKKIKYYSNPDNKRRYTVIEADEKFADGYQEFQREEWRFAKDRERNEAYYSLTAIEDEKGYQMEDKLNGDPLENIIAAEDKAERLSKLKAVLQSLTPEQHELVVMLKKGKTVTEIADKLGVSKAAVSQMRMRIQEKIKKVLN